MPRPGSVTGATSSRSTSLCRRFADEREFAGNSLALAAVDFERTPGEPVADADTRLAGDENRSFANLLEQIP